MQKKYLTAWFLLLIALSAIAASFVIFSAKEVWNYQKLGIAVPAKVEKWKIHELDSGKYAVTAEYSYGIKNKFYRGYTTFQEVFLNEHSAVHAIKRWNEKKWSAWYRGQQPEISSLIKIFPYKSVLNALISVGILVYFFYLKKSVNYCN